MSTTKKTNTTTPRYINLYKRKLLCNEMKSKFLYNKTLSNESLPNPFVPASSDFFAEQFYWDSFFIMTGLATEGEKGYKVIKDITENFAHLIKKLGYIPNSSDSYNTHSQPPFFSSAILLTYDYYKDKKWLKKMYRALKKEYKYWNSELHRTEGPLLLKYNDTKEIRNGKIDLNYNAIQESGWDMTLRFGDKCHKVAALDLNCLIYKILKDLEFISHEIKKRKSVQSKWNKKAKKLRLKINKFMFNKKEGLYFDYNPEEKKKLQSKTLATFFPLFTKVATKAQAKKVKDNLELFEEDYGLTTTTKDLMNKGIQWGYPNGWAPLQYIAIHGLLNYGYETEALRIAKKYTGKLKVAKGWPEKISMIRVKKPVHDERYSHQKETFWTLGVYKSLTELINIDSHNKNKQYHNRTD